MKPTIDPRKTLQSCRIDMKLLEKFPCDEAENNEYAALVKEGKPLPEGVFAYADFTDAFYKIYDPKLTDAEIAELLAYKQIYLLKTIKSCVVFFTTLAVIGLVFGVFSILLTL